MGTFLFMPYADPSKRKEYLRQYKLAHKKELAVRAHMRHLKTYVRHPRLQVSVEHKRNRKAKADKKYVTCNRSKVTDKQRTWRRANAIHLNTEIQLRKQTDVNFRLRVNLRRRVNAAVKRNQRAGSAVKDLGCTIPEFKLYIESKFSSGMTWENYGKWHLDHIIALCKFDLSIREQFLAGTHYTNYQPLWGKDNCRKNKF